VLHRRFESCHPQSFCLGLPTVGSGACNSEIPVRLRALASMIETEKKYGIKLSIIGSADYEDYKDVCDAILSRGFKAVVVDNGNMVFERVN
jgi:hypothetical protein